ncbi:MAG: hypothetical protein ACRERD_10595 [Candidatus Binatia bacterium]
MPEQNLATKLDLTELERTMKEIEANLHREMQDLEHRLFIKLGSLMVVGLTAVAILVKLL